ncbi:MAG TPA: SpoIIE family protein phosphatase [Bacteroidia bacterium]|jgi:PAS domain S-box-containing protein|nr:SpoIIE family protein phosphatase [Bacteroidia bacterium]
MKSVSETILQNLNTLLVVVAPGGEVSYVSPSVQRLLGFDSQELLGNGWWELPRASAEESELVKNQILSVMQTRTNGVPAIEREMCSSSGDKKHIVWNVCPAEDGGLVGIGYDITERKRAELLLDEKIKELQHKNKELLESISYAERIQQSILADKSGLSQYINESFIYYQPKDIVSGDLYWYHKKENKLFVAAVDCTGHGVPGALMSVIANGLLRNNIVKKELSGPHEILHAMDEELRLSLLKEGTADGMDIALCEINLLNKTCKFAGAFRPLLLVRDNQVKEYKGSKFPIGQYADFEKTFELHELHLQEGDALYLFSDGYTDQFGGERNRKLNRKNFYELLLSIQDMNMEEQCSFLEYAHNNWKQNEPQTDDVLVIGLKI